MRTPQEQIEESDAMKNETTVDLLPCPHCGWHLIELTHALGEYWCRCHKCSSFALACASVHDAVAAWNLRAHSPAVRELILHAKRCVSVLKKNGCEWSAADLNAAIATAEREALSTNMTGEAALPARKDA